MSLGCETPTTFMLVAAATRTVQPIKTGVKNEEAIVFQNIAQTIQESPSFYWLYFFCLFILHSYSDISIQLFIKLWSILVLLQ